MAGVQALDALSANLLTRDMNVRIHDGGGDVTGRPLRGDSQVALALCNVCDAVEQDVIARAMIHFFYAHHCTDLFVEAAVIEELQSQRDPNAELFRGSGANMKVISTFLSQLGRTFVVSTFKDLMRKMMAMLEIDPDRYQDLEFLKECAVMFMNASYGSLPTLPCDIAEVLYQIKCILLKRGISNERVTDALLSLIYLRLYVPVVASPEQFHILMPSDFSRNPNATRFFVNLSKILSRIAGRHGFQPEDSLAGVNVYISQAHIELVNKINRMFCLPPTPNLIQDQLNRGCMTAYALENSIGAIATRIVKYEEKVRNKIVQYGGGSVDVEDFNDLCSKLRAVLPKYASYAGTNYPLPNLDLFDEGFTIDISSYLDDTSHYERKRAYSTAGLVGAGGKRPSRCKPAMLDETTRQRMKRKLSDHKTRKQSLSEEELCALRRCVSGDSIVDRTTWFTYTRLENWNVVRSRWSSKSGDIIMSVERDRMLSTKMQFHGVWLDWNKIVPPTSPKMSVVLEAKPALGFKARAASIGLLLSKLFRKKRKN